jgi:SAM-dependent methyltransferase
VAEDDGKNYLEQVYNAKDDESLRKVYDLWADEYDLHVQKFGYRIPAVLAGLFCRYVPIGDGSILDAGAGTGILGESLAILKYHSVAALDLSERMLAQARHKAVYASYTQAALGGPLPYSDKQFSAVISGGTFTEGHAPPDSFDELLRITKPGGFLVFTVLAKVYEQGGFKAKQLELEEKGKWKLAEMTPEFQSMPLESPKAKNRAFVYKVI